MREKRKRDSAEEKEIKRERDLCSSRHTPQVKKRGKSPENETISPFNPVCPTPSPPSLSILTNPDSDTEREKEFLESFTTCFSHSGYCIEEEDFIWHKGIEPNYPKGYYCCRNFCSSSGKQLRLVYQNSVFVVIGACGPLGPLSHEDSQKIMNKINFFGTIL
jgi:hypothetical protein